MPEPIFSVIASTLLDLIPDDLKSRARDAVVDVVTNQAEEHLGHDAARKLRGLRSDAGFLKAFDEGLQRALQRFVVEYEEQDEDLAAAIAEDPTIFENKEVQDALLTMLKRPGTYLVEEREQIVQTFASVLPTRKKRERVDRAVTYLLRCLAEELWHLPELQPVYSLHFQKGSYETLRQQLDLQKAHLMALSELDVGLRDAMLQLADAIAIHRLSPPAYPALTSVAQQHRDQRWKELEKHYQYLTKQIEALQKDYMRSMDSESRISIAERLAEAKAERELVVDEMEMVEQAGLPPRQAVYHNLPQPDFVEFIGRKQELALVHSVLQPNNPRFFVSIEGIGGVGKTALALRAAYHYLHNYASLPLEQRFDAIVWTSAKTLTLGGAGFRSRLQIADSVDDIVKAIVETFDCAEIMKEGPERRFALLQRMLRQHRTLLVVDNLESIDDPTALSFLNELPPPTKVLVTTRYRVDAAVVQVVQLEGMTWQDTNTLVSRLSAEKAVDLTESQVHQLFRFTGGLPLVVVWSIAQMGFGYEVDRVLSQIGESTGDIVKHCFSESMQVLGEGPAILLLMALSLFVTDASKAAMLIVAGTQDDDAIAASAVAQLVRLSLVTRHNDRLGLLPLTRQFSSELLSESGDFAGQARKRYVAYFASLVRDLLGTAEEATTERRHNFPAAIREMNNILGALEFAIDQKDLDSTFVIASSITSVLWEMGDRDQLTRVAAIAVEAARQIGLPAEEGWLRTGIIGSLLEQGRYDEALLQISDLRELGEDQGSVNQTAFAAWFEARILDYRKQYAEAERLLLRALDTACDFRPHSELICTLGDVLVHQHRYEEAESLYLERIRLGHTFGEMSDLVAWGHMRLGRLCHKWDRLNEAEEQLRTAIELAEDRYEVLGHGHALFGLARLKLKQGELAEACRLAKVSRERFVEAGSLVMTSNVEELLASVDCS